jgi:hypothetical protein
MKAFATDSASPQLGKLPRFLRLLTVPCIALCLLLPGPARADQESKDAKKSKIPTEGTKPTHKVLKPDSREKEKTEKVLVTGSLIPRTVSRSSGALDTTFPVYVIDGQRIQRSGAVNVAGVLKRSGIGR